MSADFHTLINLDGRTIYDESSLHREIVRQMEGRDDFPDFYGRNVHALYDVFTGMLVTPIRLHLRYSSQLQASSPEAMNTIAAVVEMTTTVFHSIGSPEQFIYQESDDREAM